MYETIYKLPDVMCVASNNPTDWMVVYYHAVMLGTSHDEASYVVGVKPRKQLPFLFEGPIESFTMHAEL